MAHRLAWFLAEEANEDVFRMIVRYTYPVIPPAKLSTLHQLAVNLGHTQCIVFVVLLCGMNIGPIEYRGPSSVVVVGHLYNCFVRRA